MSGRAWRHSARHNNVTWRLPSARPVTQTSGSDAADLTREPPSQTRRAAVRLPSVGRVRHRRQRRQRRLRPARMRVGGRRESWAGAREQSRARGRGGASDGGPQAASARAHACVCARGEGGCQRVIANARARAPPRARTMRCAPPSPPPPLPPPSLRCWLTPSIIWRAKTAGGWRPGCRTRFLAGVPQC